MDKVWKESMEIRPDASAEDIIRKLDKMSKKAGIDYYRAQSK